MGARRPTAATLERLADALTTLPPRKPTSSGWKDCGDATYRESVRVHRSNVFLHVHAELRKAIGPVLVERRRDIHT